MMDMLLCGVERVLCTLICGISGVDVTLRPSVTTRVESHLQKGANNELKCFLIGVNRPVTGAMASRRQGEVTHLDCK